MKRSFRKGNFYEESIETYYFDDMNKQDAAVIVERFNNDGFISNIHVYNEEEYTDKVSLNISSPSMLAQQINYLDIDYVSFTFQIGNTGYGVSISIPENLVNIRYRTKEIPYDFESLMKQIEEDLKTKTV